MNTKNLPEWAVYKKEQDIIEVDPNIVYPLYLTKLGYNDNITQAQLEVARRCFTEDLLKAAGSAIHLRILRNDKFRLKNYPPGEPLKWRREYKRISAQKSK